MFKDTQTSNTADRKYISGHNKTTCHLGKALSRNIPEVINGSLRTPIPANQRFSGLLLLPCQLLLVNSEALKISLA